MYNYLFILNRIIIVEGTLAIYLASPGLSAAPFSCWDQGVRPNSPWRIGAGRPDPNTEWYKDLLPSAYQLAVYAASLLARISYLIKVN